MKRLPLVAFLLVLLSAFAPAVYMPVPAIGPNNEGIMSTFYADARPGSGAIYVDTEPFIGIETQNSERVAARVAADISGVDRTKYDIFFRMVANAEIVDGPSAGAAMTLLLLSVFENRSIRADFSMTGTIRSDGSIGAVGGVLQKAQSASEAGIKVFAIPRGQAMQGGKNVVKYAKENWNQTVIEVSTVVEAARIAFSSGPVQANATQHEMPPLNLSATAFPQTYQYSFFRNLTDGQISAAEALVRELTPNAGADERELLNASAEALNASRYLLGKNYLYSAANIAFITKGELMLLKGINASRDDIAALLSGVEALTGNTSAVRITGENFELVAGGNLRLHWAEKKAAEARAALALASGSELLGVQRDAITAQNWADAARQMLNAAASIGGEPVGQTALYDYAAAQIREASRYVTNASDEEAQWHLESSRELFSAGDYAAAALDADFALSFARAGAYAEGRDAKQLLAAASLKSTSNFWASLYAAHAQYLAAEAMRSGERETALDALKVAYYAESLEASVKAMGSLLKAKQQLPATATAVQTPVPVQKQEAFALDTRGVVFIATVLVIALLLVLAVLIPARLRRPRHRQDMVEKLEQRLAEGWISERTYERLRGKYEHARIVHGEQPGQPRPKRAHLNIKKKTT